MYVLHKYLHKYIHTYICTIHTWVTINWPSLVRFFPMQNYVTSSSLGHGWLDKPLLKSRRKDILGFHTIHLPIYYCAPSHCIWEIVDQFSTILHSKLPKVIQICRSVYEFGLSSLSIPMVWNGSTLHALPYNIRHGICMIQYLVHSIL